jgi:hypothetical protein
MTLARFVPGMAIRNNDDELDGDRARKGWLDFLDGLLWAANSTESPSAEDRDYGPFETPTTLRARHPADFDDLAAWLDAGDHAARLGVLADELMPNRVDRLRCCRGVEQRSKRWHDPIDWRVWRDAQLAEFEQRRADLLAIVEELSRRIEAGMRLPAEKAAAEAPQNAPKDRWMRKTEAAKAAEISVERLRPWCTRDNNPLPTKWEGGVELVNLDDVLRERDAKAARAEHTDAHAPTTREDTKAHAVPKQPRRKPRDR